MPQEYIEIHGARENNLKNVSLRIPKRKITIFTGVSGSGKSSIVFDTIATESQRLLNENFSRSVIYCLGKIDYSLKYITRKNNHEETSNLLRLFGRLYSKIKYMELQNFNNRTVQPFLEETKHELLEFSTRMAQHFFSYS